MKTRNLILGLALVSSSCGYSLAGRGDFLPDHIKVIGIPAFQNVTDRPQLGELFTEKVVEEFASRGKYVVRPESVGVDAVLSGRVTSFQVVPAVLAGGEQEETANQAARYTVVVRAEVVFSDLIEDQEIWSDSSFAFRDEYEVGENPEEYFDQEGLALDRLAEEFAKTLVSRILEAF